MRISEVFNILNYYNQHNYKPTSIAIEKQEVSDLRGHRMWQQTNIRGKESLSA